MAAQIGNSGDGSNGSDGGDGRQDGRQDLLLAFNLRLADENYRKLIEAKINEFNLSSCSVQSISAIISDQLLQDTVEVLSQYHLKNKAYTTGMMMFLLFGLWLPPT